MHRWAPNRLRKRQATDVQRGENLEAARIYLGHKDPKVTLIYAEADKDKGIEIARKYG